MPAPSQASNPIAELALTLAAYDQAAEALQASSPSASESLGGVEAIMDRLGGEMRPNARGWWAVKLDEATWEALCGELGEEPAAVALAWLLHQREVVAPIIGPRTMDQLDGASMRALDLELEDDTLRAIDEIFPGPGRAPEAYAW